MSEGHINLATRETGRGQLLCAEIYFNLPYYGTDNDDYVDGEGFCCSTNVLKSATIGTGNDNPELYQHYYHSDHLGSSSLITNLERETVQHIWK